MTARILRFPLAQEQIRLAMPEVDLGLNWTVIAALALNFGIWLGVAMIAWRFL